MCTSQDCNNCMNLLPTKSNDNISITSQCDKISTIFPINRIIRCIILRLLTKLDLENNPAHAQTSKYRYYR